MALILEVTPETDIWKQHPSLKLIKEFRELKDKEGDERSGNIIKSIFLIWDHKGNLRDSGIDEDQLIRDVSETLLGDPDFDWSQYETFKEYFLSVNTTRLESMRLNYENEILGLGRMLKTWKWHQKDAEKRAKVVKEYKILFDDLIEVTEKIKLEVEAEVEYEGGYNKSLLEQIGTDE